MSGEFCRSVSSSSYGETGGSSGAASATTIVNGTSGCGTGRYVSSTSSASVSSTSSSRERSSVDAAADIISRYSPAGYVPSIQRQQQASGGNAHHWRHRSTSSSLNELFGGDEREVERKDLRLESSLSSSSSSSSVATGAADLWSKSSKRRPPTNSTVLTTVGHARTPDSSVSLAEVTSTVDDHVTHKPNDDDKNDDTRDDQHNNNDNTGRDGNSEDIACGYGVNNNDDERDDDNDDEDEDGDENEDEDVDVDRDGDDANDNDNLNNCHHRFHQQRRHRPDEVSPAKHNVLSPAAAGGGGLIGVSSLDLLTNLATNPHNTELLINNNAQDKVTGGKEETEIATSDEVTRGADNVTSIVTFLQRDRVSDRDIPEDGEEEDNVSDSTDEISFGGIDSVAGRPSVTHGDDPSIPSTSRRTDQLGLFSSTTSNNLTSSPTNLSTAHQSIYRGVNEQYVSALIKKVMCSGAEQHRLFNSWCLLIDR